MGFACGLCLLYQLVEQHYPAFVAALAEAGRSLPRYEERDFEDFLKCGRLEYGFLRVRCNDCRAEKLVAFSCKRRGFCPSCGARRMVENAALLIDEYQQDFLQPNRRSVASSDNIPGAHMRGPYLEVHGCVLTISRRRFR